MNTCVGIDLHRRRSVIARMTPEGGVLETVRIDNDPVALSLELAKAGPDPEVVLEATYGWYWPASCPVTASRALAEKSQPMALLGRWATTKAPTTMKALKPRNSRIWLPASCWKVPLATARGSPTTRLTAKTANIDQATQLQRLPTVSPRLLRVSNRGA